MVGKWQYFSPKFMVIVTSRFKVQYYCYYYFLFFWGGFQNAPYLNGWGMDFMFQLKFKLKLDVWFLKVRGILS